MKIPIIIPITDLRNDSASVLSSLQSDGQPVVVTQRGRAAAVLLSIKAYERMTEDIELLRAILLGEKEMNGNQGYSMESVLSDAETLLAAEPCN
jgi:prevent-host-death family protein